MKINWKIAVFILASVMIIYSLYLALEFWVLPPNKNLYTYLFTKQPSDTVEKFHRYTCDGDIESAEKLLSATVPFPKEYAKFGIGYLMKECKENGGFKTIVFDKEEIENERAGVYGKVEFKNNRTDNFAMKLYLEKGEWKIAFNPDAAK